MRDSPSRLSPSEAKPNLNFSNPSRQRMYRPPKVQVLDLRVVLVSPEGLEV